ncbi:PREDICTED: integrin alpha-IIb-like [Calidris pugnax]|uniref:integrin alpha-IIb-like n=1 Tax=Calidris pugnax TaxID=198806 RepID=UPI00071E62D6|nr:PREDICTED: integrin alpha-IIb-like [Calidris pugnax]
MGLLYSVEVDAILTRFHGTSLLWPERPGRPTEDPMAMDYEDGYRGYSVAVGEFDGDPETKELVVGVPNKSNTRGEVSGAPGARLWGDARWWGHGWGRAPRGGDRDGA